MSMPVVYLPEARVVSLPEARDDLDSAYIHYEQQRAGLGTHFAAAVRIKWRELRATRLAME
jgi:hypothetical protein